MGAGPLAGSLPTGVITNLFTPVVDIRNFLPVRGNGRASPHLKLTTIQATDSAPALTQDQFFDAHVPQAKMGAA